ncbi:MAG: hypothetical protein GWN14_27575, partial [candidate division Zixibacteria bacterium]|nr:hypothetical protein [Gammaproteobacteria bacterium]NIX59583.1 hypothetical protein [candidate division Zixibacteria bacterium]
MAQIFQELIRYPSAVAGMIILAIMVTGSLYAVIRYPYAEIGAKWYQDASDNSKYVPRTAYPKWINTFRNEDLPETIILHTQDMPETTSVKILDNGNPDYTFTLEFDYPYQGFPTEGMLYFETEYKGKQPFATFTWFTPDGREFRLKNAAIDSSMRYYIDENLDQRQLTDHQIQYKYQPNDLDAAPVLYGLFADPDKDYPVAVPGTYTLEIKVLA